MKRVSIAVALFACALIVTGIAGSHLAAAWNAKHQEVNETAPSIVPASATTPIVAIDPNQAFSGTECYYRVVHCGPVADPDDLCGADADTQYWIACHFTGPAPLCFAPVAFRFQTGTPFGTCDQQEFCGRITSEYCEFTSTQVANLDSQCRIVTAILCCFEEECPIPCEDCNR